MTVTPKLRRAIPQRTCGKKYRTNRSYKPYLRSDFNTRCGYCDVRDKILGGENSFHVDHFAPKKTFTALEFEYSNLIYACSSCNNSKNDDWPMPSHSPSHNGSTGYVDPCVREYDDHLERAADGSIIAKTTLGEYIIRNLKLYLKKYSIRWQLDMLDEQLSHINALLEQKNQDDPEIIALKETYKELAVKFTEYYRLDWQN